MKTEAFKWSLVFIGLMVLISIVGAVLNFGGRYFGTVGERVIFEESYQRSAGQETMKRNLEGELATINRLLNSSTLTDTQRADLLANKAGIQHQLSTLD